MVCTVYVCGVYVRCVCGVGHGHATGICVVCDTCHVYVCSVYTVYHVCVVLC